MKKIYFVVIALIVGVWACKKAPIDGQYTNLEHISYNPTSYTITPPQGFPAMEIPADNPMTAEGIELGRHLFYDPILSKDSTISCSSCHDIKKAFTDGRALAVGVEGKVGPRSSMSLMNIGYSWIKSRDHNFMWDGSIGTLEEQALAPIENPLEMDESWVNVEKKLRRHNNYPQMFREAFGIAHTGEITKELAAKAITQFERTLNSANAKYDQDVHVPFVYMTPQELRGFQLFMGDASGGSNAKDGECGHCHSISNGKALFARNEYSNNGIDSVGSFNEFSDNGYGDITGNYSNNGQFKEVTLRNIALTAPYMHDGRFATLREVIDHYTSGGHSGPNVASEITTSNSLPTFTEAEKDDLEAFLHALTDTTYFNKPEWSSPF